MLKIQTFVRTLNKNRKFGFGNLNQGFTIVELLVVMTIFVTLVGIASINLVGAKQRTSLNTSADILAGDLRQQQVKAMVGDTEGRAAPDTYGIHFDSNSYTLFHGAVFNILDSTNFTIDLGDNISIAVSPNNLIFSRVSGEVESAGSIILIDNTTKTERALDYNRFGVITDVN